MEADLPDGRVHRSPVRFLTEDEAEGAERVLMSTGLATGTRRVRAPR